MKKLTEKEWAMLNSIVNSEYQDGDVVGHDIWLDYVVDSKSRGGVLQTLAKKGFVEYTISTSQVADITESTISITQSGYDAYVAQTSKVYTA